MRDALKKAEALLQKETDRQIEIVFYSSALALARYYGWGKKRFQNLWHIVFDSWKECGEDNGLSMLQLLENETGVEIRSNDGRSYHEIHFLDPNTKLKVENRAVMIRIRQKQLDWVGPQIVAAVFLALHRKEGYGYKRLCEFMEHFDTIRNQYNYDPAALRKQSLEELDIELIYESEL